MPFVRSLALLLLLAAVAAAQGMGPPKRVDSWMSKHNQKRLRFSWDLLPPYKPTKLPDGSEEPPKAPWPFLIYVIQNSSKARLTRSSRSRDWTSRPIKPARAWPPPEPRRNYRQINPI